MDYNQKSQLLDLYKQIKLMLRVRQKIIKKKTKMEVVQQEEERLKLKGKGKAKGRERKRKGKAQRLKGQTGLFMTKVVIICVRACQE